MQPKVSVIIPVYNASLFLNETIQSVLNQRLKELELILLDDGSTDASADICEEYVAKDMRVFYKKQTNAGVSVARNEGLLMAKGEYVYFLDSDDTIGRDFLKSSYAEAKKKDADVVVVGDYFESRFPDVMALPTCAMFLKRTFLEKYPEIRFPAGIQPCEDGLFSHQLLTQTAKLGFNPSAEYHYREHANQNHIRINDDAWKVVNRIPDWLDLLKDFYTKHKLFEAKALHLSLFMEHEPFELRYLQMKLNNEQKEFLFNLIHAFVYGYVRPHLELSDRLKLSESFRMFLQAKDYKDFDKWYESYLRKMEKKRKTYLMLTKLIPFSQVKKNLRIKINHKYSK